MANNYRYFEIHNFPWSVNTDWPELHQTLFLPLRIAASVTL